MIILAKISTMTKIAIFSVVFLMLLFSCGGKKELSVKTNLEDTTQVSDTLKSTKTNEITKKEEVVIVDSSDVITNTEILNEKGQLDPNSSPTAIVQTIIKSAKTRNFGPLLKLCNESIDMDGDAKDICGMGGASKKNQDNFCEYFGKAKITGKPRINKGIAEVDIETTAEGRSKETIVCQVKYDRWYLKGL